MTPNNTEITGQNDPNKPYNMGLARKIAKDVLFGLARKHKRAKEENTVFSLEDEEKYAMGKVYDGLLILTNNLKKKEYEESN